MEEEKRLPSLYERALTVCTETLTRASHVSSVRAEARAAERAMKMPRSGELSEERPGAPGPSCTHEEHKQDAL